MMSHALATLQCIHGNGPTQHHPKTPDDELLHGFSLRMIASSALSPCANCSPSMVTAMPGDFDARDCGDPRDGDNFDIYDGRWLDDPRDPDDRDLDVERDRDSRDHDPRDAFVEGLELPRSVQRELVQDDRESLYELNGEDSRTLATIGAFRVVAERDLEVLHERPSVSHHDTLEHLRDEGRIRFVSVSEDERAAVLTADGRDSKPTAASAMRATNIRSSMLASATRASSSTTRLGSDA
jgi:hypothetical protein